MNVLEARVVLRDRAFLDVIDLAASFLMRHGRAYARLAAVVLPPAYLVTWAIASIAGWGWGWFAAILLSPLAAAPFTALASRLVFEPEASVYDVLASTASAMPRLLVARVLQALALTLAASCLVLPALWILALSFYLNEVFVLERAPVAAGIARMQRLLSGQSGDILMGWLFIGTLAPLVVVLGDLVGRSLLEDFLQIGAPPSLFQTGGSAIGLAALWWYVPFEATCRFFLYVNGRTRTEGWDVQTRFAAIAARANDEVQDAERASIRPGRAA